MFNVKRDKFYSKFYGNLRQLYSTIANWETCWKHLQENAFSNVCTVVSGEHSVRYYRGYNCKILALAISLPRSFLSQYKVWPRCLTPLYGLHPRAYISSLLCKNSFYSIHYYVASQSRIKMFIFLVGTFETSYSNYKREILYVWFVPLSLKTTERI